MLALSSLIVHDKYVLQHLEKLATITIFSEIVLKVARNYLLYGGCSEPWHIK